MPRSFATRGRVRTGVALYSVAPEGHRIEDHYITDHWNGEEARWQLTDPRIDEIQRPAIQEGLVTLDLPDGVFLSGWQLVEELRAGRVPEQVGFPSRKRQVYGRDKLFADFVGLTGHELPVHAWWGIGDPLAEAQPGDEALIDRMIERRSCGEITRGIDATNPAALQEA